MRMPRRGCARIADRSATAASWHGRRRLQPAQSRARLDPRRGSFVEADLTRKRRSLAREQFRLTVDANRTCSDPRQGPHVCREYEDRRFDPELKAALDAEQRRQEDHIELIASENYASPRVLEAQGSVLTNKYAEGYPGKRYYGGCEYVDIAEQLAIDRAKKLFGAAYANVQPHSGSQANAAAYLALINPGDTMLGMSLDHGGHLTHGAKVNFSGKLFKAVQYGLDPTHRRDRLRPGRAARAGASAAA